MAKAPKVPRVALLWQKSSLGLYSNAPFDDLYKGVGHNNGNLAFVYAIASHIANPMRWLPWHTSVETLKKTADIVVIPCANQIGKHTDLGTMADKLEQAGLPVVSIGLGAQADSYDHDVAVSEGTLRWAKVIAQLHGGSAPNIYTRGAYTTGQLEKLGIPGAQTGGCPSYFINPAPDLGHRIYANWTKQMPPRFISVAGGHQSWAKIRTIEHQLISMIMDPVTPGQYVVQSMSDMIKVSRGEFDLIDPVVLEHIHRHTVPHYTPEEFRNWCRIYAKSFYDVPAWMDSLRNYDLTVGSRYHGIALALQAERMGLTVTIDSRTRELCENTMVPNIRQEDLQQPLTRTALGKIVQFDPVAYDKHRAAAAARYVPFLEANSVVPSPFLYKIAEAAE
ncbi:polysaccharide pyruvyl transferase family protein [Roseococcus sp. YIM B11640]|uniref:polysaccharide pyruvyl transferase family protein n=1 Tax=Roseococcus sp. YIM B11640 TaxID=3133973 RepID=UPI003C7D2154